MAIGDIPRTEFGQPVYEYDTTGNAFYGDTTIDDTPIQEMANGTPIAPQAFTEYPEHHNHGPKENYLADNPGLFLTNKPSPIVRHSQPRAVYGTGPVVMATARIVGINFIETSGAGTATITITRDGSTSTGSPLMFISLAANESVRDFPPLPIEAVSGIYVTITGSAKGIVYTEEERNV